MLVNLRMPMVIGSAVIALAIAAPAMASDIGLLPANPGSIHATSPHDEATTAPSTSLSELVDAHAHTEVLDADQECVAAAIYFEARGEPIEGQLAVAEVILNRAASGKYPASICAVVKQPAQFSFVRRGRIPSIAKASDAWRRAVAVAHVAFEGLIQRIASDVLWYHADYVHPSWGSRLTRVTQIGAHIFYNRNG